MSIGLVGGRYARALLELADEAKQLDRVGREVASFGETWETSRELRDTFENPAIGAEQRKQLLEAIARRLSLSPMTKNTLKLLSDRRRMRYVPELVDAFRQLAEERSGHVRAEVVSAGPLPESYYLELQKALEAVTGRTVTLDKKQDPSLIAGVVTRLGDKVFDGSLKNRLDELRDELLSQ